MTTVRRLGQGDEDVVARLAERPPQTALLADDSAVFLVAFDGDDDPIGFVLAYELPRRHGDERMLLVYEVDVDEAHQRQGVAASLLAALAGIARKRRIREGFVLTEPDNAPANALYASQGGERRTSSSGTSGTTPDLRPGRGVAPAGVACASEPKAEPCPVREQSEARAVSGRENRPKPARCPTREHAEARAVSRARARRSPRGVPRGRVHPVQAPASSHDAAQGEPPARRTPNLARANAPRKPCEATVTSL